MKKLPNAVYTEGDIQKAIHDVQTNGLSTYETAKKYKIPYQTLYCRIRGTRGNKRAGRGRGPALSQKVEEELANGLRTMEKWGFGLCRMEVLEIVQQYILDNNLINSVPFANGKPGED